jgi:hypothetical protein
MYSEILKTPNPFTNFIVGITEGLAGNETSFYQCFPQSWKIEVSAD